MAVFYVSVFAGDLRYGYLEYGFGVKSGSVLHEEGWTGCAVCRQKQLPPRLARNPGHKRSMLGSMHPIFSANCPVIAWAEVVS